VSNKKKVFRGSLNKSPVILRPGFSFPAREALIEMFFSLFCGISNPEDMRILSDGTLSVIIDVQERLFPHMAEGELLKKNLLILIEGLKVLDIPVLLTQQYTRGLGPSLSEIAVALPAVSPIEKMTFSCCGEPVFMLELEKNRRKTVLLAGIETHVCVLQTALDLFAAGYQPVVIKDCVSSRKLIDKETSLARMFQEGVLFTTVESVLFELTRTSGNDTFKAISKLVK
jgi:nicotinamidase-related amidase